LLIKFAAVEIWHCVVVEGEHCDRTRERALICCRAKRSSARVLRLRGFVETSEAKAELSQRLESARRAVKTNGAGFVTGSMLDSMAGRAAAAYRGARKGHPPIALG